jgi:hypothetical protein
LIGIANLGLDRVLTLPDQLVDKWYVIRGKRGTDHGSVNLRVTWKPRALSAPAASASHTAVPHATAGTGGYYQPVQRPSAPPAAYAAAPPAYAPAPAPAPAPPPEVRANRTHSWGRCARLCQ